RSRSNRRTTRSRSSALICWDRDGPAIRSPPAARPKFSSSATATKYRSWRSSTPITLRAVGDCTYHERGRRSWQPARWQAHAQDVQVPPHDGPVSAGRHKESGWNIRGFLVEVTTTVPQGTSQDEVDQRRAAEAVRARELAATGNLARLWRPVGELRSIGVWRAADEDELQEEVLGTLP